MDLKGLTWDWGAGILGAVSQEMMEQDQSELAMSVFARALTVAQSLESVAATVCAIDDRFDVLVDAAQVDSCSYWQVLGGLATTLQDELGRDTFRALVSDLRETDRWSRA